MANQEHLDILKEGVEVWNQWRKENKGGQVDLSEANLTEAERYGARTLDSLGMIFNHLILRLKLGSTRRFVSVFDRYRPGEKRSGVLA